MPLSFPVFTNVMDDLFSEPSREIQNALRGALDSLLRGKPAPDKTALSYASDYTAVPGTCNGVEFQTLEFRQAAERLSRDHQSTLTVNTDGVVTRAFPGNDWNYHDVSGSSVSNLLQIDGVNTLPNTRLKHSVTRKLFEILTLKVTGVKVLFRNPDLQQGRLNKLLFGTRDRAFRDDDLPVSFLMWFASIPMQMFLSVWLGAFAGYGATLLCLIMMFRLFVCYYIHPWIESTD